MISFSHAASTPLRGSSFLRSLSDALLYGASTREESDLIYNTRRAESLRCAWQRTSVNVHIFVSHCVALTRMRSEPRWDGKEEETRRRAARMVEGRRGPQNVLGYITR